MVHLPFAALTALLVATSAAATNINTDEPAINNLILSPVHSTSTSTDTITHTASTTLTTDTTTPPAGGPFAHVVHKLDETTATAAEHHRIVTPTEERTGPPTETGPPFENTMHKGGVGFGLAAGGAANIAHAANGAGSLVGYGGGLKAAAVAAVVVVVGVVGAF
jgi:hypothetical protein